MSKKVSRKKLSARERGMVKALVAAGRTTDSLLCAADPGARRKYNAAAVAVPADATEEDELQAELDAADAAHAQALAELLTHVANKEQEVHAVARATVKANRQKGMEKTRASRWPDNAGRDVRQEDARHLRAVHEWSERRIAKEILGGEGRKTTIRRWLAEGGPIRSASESCKICNATQPTGRGAIR